MISTFIDSWGLFAETYLTAWLLAALLGGAGIVVVARNQIFLGAAIAQTSMLGVGLALWATYLPLSEGLRWLQAPRMVSIMAIGSALVTAIATRGGDSQASETSERKVGWIYLTSGSGLIVLLAHSPVGMIEIGQRTYSSVIGANLADVWLYVALLAAMIVAWSCWHRPLTLLLIDTRQAVAVGLPVQRLEWILAILLAIVVGLALRTSGMLFTIGCLVLPAMVARSLCREMRWMFVLSPLIAIIGAIAGFVIGNHVDLPGGPLTVLILALCVPVGGLYKRITR